MSEKNYSAASLQVLSGLEPVRRRPGMYTDTSRPNHLVQEVVDNSVDEAISGYAKNIEVTLFKDGSIEVIDDGRGMPVDDHPEYKISGVELILTRLHSGGNLTPIIITTQAASMVLVYLWLTRCPCGWKFRSNETDVFFNKNMQKVRRRLI